MNEGLGAADIGELGAVDDFVFAVGFFVFATFKTFVGFLNDIAGGFLHKHSLNTGSKSVGVADAERGVIFVEEEELDGDVVFDFVDFVGPMKDVEKIINAMVFAVVVGVVCGAGSVSGVGAGGGEVDGGVGGICNIGVSCASTDCSTGYGVGSRVCAGCVILGGLGFENVLVGLWCIIIHNIILPPHFSYIIA